MLVLGVQSLDMAQPFNKSYDPLLLHVVKVHFGMTKLTSVPLLVI